MGGNRSFSSREMIKILKKNNYKYVRGKGDHKIYSNGINSIVITVPKINKMIARRLIKENNLIL